VERENNTTGEERTSHNRGRENITQQEKREHHTIGNEITSHNRGREH
jgi:hypothetical protein